MAGTVRLRRGRASGSGATGRPGWVQEMGNLTQQVAALKYAQLEELRASAGPKWGDVHIPVAEALARMDAWDQPNAAILKQAGELSVAEALQAALQAVRLRRRALASGEWVPPEGHPYALVHPTQQAATAHGMGAAMAPGGPGAQPAAGTGKKKPKIKAPQLGTREDVGGERVLSGQAALSRAVAPANPSVPVPVSGSQIGRGDVVPNNVA